MAKSKVEQTVYSLRAEAPKRPERRKGERHLSLLRVGALLVEGRRELCLVRNVSAGGMLIRPYSPIKSGTKVSVELKHGEMAKGVAKWTQDDLIGITFDEPVDIVAMLARSAHGPQPRMPRMEVNCIASIREDADIARARVLNISQGGMCVDSKSSLNPGANVTVSMSGLEPLAGVVKWKEDDCYGIGFNRVLAVNELMSFLQQQQRFERNCSNG